MRSRMPNLMNPRPFCNLNPQLTLKAWNKNATVRQPSPTEPESWKMALGVANIPVPTMRLKMRKTTEMQPTWRRFAGMDLSSTPENFV